jgi:hypothetical protein
MLPILPILPKKVVFFAKMLSNSMKNASNRADLPFSPPLFARDRTMSHLRRSGRRLRLRGFP